jgi:hypothetical protein
MEPIFGHVLQSALCVFLLMLQPVVTSAAADAAAGRVRL